MILKWLLTYNSDCERAGCSQTNPISGCILHKSWTKRKLWPRGNTSINRDITRIIRCCWLSVIHNCKWHRRICVMCKRWGATQKGWRFWICWEKRLWFNEGEERERCWVLFPKLLMQLSHKCAQKTAYILAPKRQIICRYQPQPLLLSPSSILFPNILPPPKKTPPTWFTYGQDSTSGQSHKWPTKIQ